MRRWTDIARHLVTICVRAFLSLPKPMKQTTLTNTAKALGNDMLEAFTARRKQLLRISLISIGLTVLSLAIVGTKLFYPFHMVVGLSIYLLSFIPLIRRIYLGHKTWQTYGAYTSTARFFRRERYRLVLALCMVTVSTLFLYLRPLDERPFAARKGIG